MVEEHEKLIGARLRAFRETLQIPRSRFAVTIGFGSDRIASYEAGRAPLLYVVFLAVQEKFSISPLWLATGNGSPKWPDDRKHLCKSVDFSARDAFSVVYSRNLEEKINALVIEAKKHSDDMTSLALKSSLSLYEIDPESLTPAQWRRFDRISKLLADQIKRLKSDLALRKKARANTEQILTESKKELTETETSRRLAEVKSQLPSLLVRLNRATKESGKMSALADFLGKASGQKVPLASVSRWLSGKREPGGEITLLLLHWVEQQERQN